MIHNERGMGIRVEVKPNGGVDVSYVARPKVPLAPIAGASDESLLASTDPKVVERSLSGAVSMAELYDQVAIRDHDFVGSGIRPAGKIKR